MDLNHLNLRVRDPAGCRDFYQRHFGFRPAFEAEGGYFIKNEGGFLLALLPPPAVEHQALPEGVHIGFRLSGPDAVAALHERLAGAGVRTGAVEDYRPDELYVTFRCWDPDGTEIEIFWDG